MGNSTAANSPQANFSKLLYVLSTFGETWTPSCLNCGGKWGFGSLILTEQIGAFLKFLLKISLFFSITKYVLNVLILKEDGRRVHRCHLLKETATGHLNFSNAIIIYIGSALKW